MKSTSPPFHHARPLGALKMLPFLRAGDFDESELRMKLAHAQETMWKMHDDALQQRQRFESTLAEHLDKAVCNIKDVLGQRDEARFRLAVAEKRAAEAEAALRREQERNTGLEFALARLTEEIEHREVHLGLASAERDELAAEVESWKRRMVPEEEGTDSSTIGADRAASTITTNNALDWLNEEPSLLAGSMNHHDEEEEEEEGSDADDDNYDQEGGEDEEEEGAFGSWKGVATGEVEAAAADYAEEGEKGEEEQVYTGGADYEASLNNSKEDADDDVYHDDFYEEGDDVADGVSSSSSNASASTAAIEEDLERIRREADQAMEQMMRHPWFVATSQPED